MGLKDVFEKIGRQDPFSSLGGQSGNTFRCVDLANENGYLRTLSAEMQCSREVKGAVAEVELYAYSSDSDTSDGTYKAPPETAVATLNREGMEMKCPDSHAMRMIKVREQSGIYTYKAKCQFIVGLATECKEVGAERQYNSDSDFTSW